MAREHAEHRQYEGDYYAQAQQKAQQNVPRFGAEDQADARAGVGPQAQSQAAMYSVQQGQRLLHNQATRGDAPAPNQNYPASSHEDLYNMVHVDLNASDLDERGRVANKLGNWLADVSNAASEAVNSSEVQWQGDAAGQAHSFFQSTADYTATTANAAQLSSNRYSQQAAAADYAQKNMPEPTGFNQQAEMNKATMQYQSGDLVGATQTMSGIQAKQQQADAAHQQAVQVLQGLDSTYHETAATQPTYTPPPQLGSGDSTSAAGFHGTSGGSGYTGAPTFGGGTPTTGTGPTPPPGAAPPPSSYVAPGTTSGGTTNFGGNPGFRPGPAAVNGFPRMTPDGLAMTGPNVPGTGGGDTLRSRPGIGRGSGFAGSRVSGGGYSGDAKETAPGKGAPGEGKATGKGATERLQRGATAAAAANKAKAGGAGAAGAAGSGKKKEEDKEHKSKIPLEDDLFEMRAERGPDGEKIVPPIIGTT